MIDLSITDCIRLVRRAFTPRLDLFRPTPQTNLVDHATDLLHMRPAYTTYRLYIGLEVVNGPIG
jgi:hypothetical protein